jgi:hypothetical protein
VTSNPSSMQVQCSLLVLLPHGASWPTFPAP